MEISKIILILHGACGVLLTGTWWWVLNQNLLNANWRHKAAFMALILPTIALVVGIILGATVVHFGSLGALDEATLGGGLRSFLGRLWLWSFLSTGLLSASGVFLAILGKGNPRFAGAAWSVLLLAIFFVNLAMSINSFH